MHQSRNACALTFTEFGLLKHFYAADAALLYGQEAQIDGTHQTLTLNRAQQLLKQKKRDLADIALACGVGGQTHMIGIFRNHLRITPENIAAGFFSTNPEASHSSGSNHDAPALLSNKGQRRW